MLVAVFERTERAVRRDQEILFVGGLIRREDMVHDDGAAGFCEQHVLEAHDAACRNVILEVHFARPGIGMHEFHMPHFPAALADFFDDGALIGFRHLNRQLLVGLRDLAAVAMQNDFRLRDLQFVAFPAHLFDQDAKMQFSTAGDQKPVGTVGFLHAQ